MKITKFGHSCLLLEIGETRILFDPGSFTQEGTAFEGIDLILLSHAHSDHLDLELLKLILDNNKSIILTNAETADFLQKNGIQAQVILASEEKQIDDVKIKAFGSFHQEVYPGLSVGANTAFMINDQFYFPGDSYFKPDASVGVLALPVSGPWVKLSEAIDYALDLKPKICLPIHDGNTRIAGSGNSLIKNILGQNGIKFLPLEIGQEYSL